ncbi:MAG: phenylalanine--tRNA ligase subunit alpha [Nitrososphaerota archaeon]|nr:phenylalanine--tRNA ligase subunit alpha [Nitrososphaerota archaeon]
MPAHQEREQPIHPIEKRVLLLLREVERLSLSEISKRLGLDLSTVSRAAQWLKHKGLCEIEETVVNNQVSLGTEGHKYLQFKLPERRLVDALRSLGDTSSLDRVSEITGMGDMEVKIGVIWAKKKGWVEIQRSSQGSLIKLLNYPEGPTDEERLLSTLKDGPIMMSELREHSATIERLARRPNVISIDPIKEHYLTLTEEGERVSRSISLEVEEVVQLTPDLITSGRWREVTFSRYDLLAPVKPVYAARLSPLTELIELVRDVFVELGFEEIKGPLVELAFWNFDALFQPQDHPAREMHDTFYLESPDRGVIPHDLARRVKAVHERGWRTGSKGWRYRWEGEEACRLLLRTHTTAATVRYLVDHKDPPIKVFTIDRVYRNENVDWKHLAELHQIDGIMMDRAVTLRSLMGIIREFYRRLGIPNVRFRPSYFPYTEPSAEVEVYLPWSNSWAELGGMGIFRPEVTGPLGVKYPVLAWGLGLERLAMTVYGIDDIRSLYRNDLRWIRSISPVSTLTKMRGAK